MTLASTGRMNAAYTNSTYHLRRPVRAELAEIGPLRRPTILLQDSEGHNLHVLSPSYDADRVLWAWRRGVRCVRCPKPEPVSDCEAGTCRCDLTEKYDL